LKLVRFTAEKDNYMLKDLGQNSAVLKQCIKQKHITIVNKINFHKNIIKIIITVTVTVPSRK